MVQKFFSVFFAAFRFQGLVRFELWGVWSPARYACFLTSFFENGSELTANRFNLHARQNFFSCVAHRRPIVLNLSTLQSPRQRHLLRRSVVHIRSVLTESGLFWTHIFSPCVAHRFPFAFSFGAFESPPQGGSHRDFIRCNPFRNTQAGPVSPTHRVNGSINGPHKLRQRSEV